jgi:hypothetical protein
MTRAHALVTMNRAGLSRWSSRRRATLAGESDTVDTHASECENVRRPTRVDHRKVEMPEKWQEINLRLDAELAQALRDLKRGHDESLAEVVLRLLRKAVRLNPANRGMPDARSSAKGARGGRGAFGAARRGKPPAREARGGSRGAAKGKPFVTREVAEGDTWAPADPKRRPASTSAGPRPARPSRPFTKVGKAFRPQQGEGGGERRRRDFAVENRNGDDVSRLVRPSDAEGTEGGRMRRPRKAKGRTSRRG